MAADLTNFRKAPLTTVSPLDPVDSISNFIFTKMEKMHLMSSNNSLWFDWNHLTLSLPGTKILPVQTRT